MGEGTGREYFQAAPNGVLLASTTEKGFLMLPHEMLPHDKW